MKILLDECVPRRFREFLVGHEVKTAPESGLAGVKNGELLKGAAAVFDVFITVDRNLSFQQNLKSLPMAVVVVHSKTNKLKDLQKLVPDLGKLLETPVSKMLHHVGRRE